MAAQKVSDVYLETMEEAENKDTEPKAPPHNSRLGAQAACRAKIFRDIFQKCSPIRQGLPALFGSSHKKFFGTLHHLELCGVALKKLSIPEYQAYQWGNTRLGYWRIAGSAILKCSITNEKLARAGYYDFPAQYEQIRNLHLCG